MEVGHDKDAADTFVLEEATTEAKRQGAGQGRDVFKLLGDSKGEAEPAVEFGSLNLWVWF